MPPFNPQQQDPRAAWANSFARARQPQMGVSDSFQAPGAGANPNFRPPTQFQTPAQPGAIQPQMNQLTAGAPVGGAFQQPPMTALPAPTGQMNTPLGSPFGGQGQATGPQYGTPNVPSTNRISPPQQRAPVGPVQQYPTQYVPGPPPGYNLSYR